MANRWIILQLLQLAKIQTHQQEASNLKTKLSICLYKLLKSTPNHMYHEAILNPACDPQLLWTATHNHIKASTANDDQSCLDSCVRV